MSMIRAQEYFAPLRSRHISLQQWERGLLFESWGSGGGRADRRKSGDINKYLASPDSQELQEIRPVKKVIARSVSFSASVGTSEPTLKTKNFARGLSFPRSLASRGEIIPEESDYCGTRRSNADLSPMFAAQSSTAYLFPRSVESGHVNESEISERTSYQDSSEDSSETFSSEGPGADVDSRPLPRRFFSGGLSFSKDKKFFSGVLSFSKDKKIFSGSLSLPKPCLAKPCGRTLDRSQSWGVNDNNYGISSQDDHGKNGAETRSTSTETGLKTSFLAKVLSFSRSLDPRGEISSDFTSKSSRRTEIRRGLSFSRSLDVNGELFSSDDCGDSGSQHSSSVPEISWSKRFISRSGLFFSRTLSPKIPRESPSENISSCAEDCWFDEPDRPTEVRPKKLFGRFSLSLSRFLDPKGDSSSANSAAGAINGAGRVDKASQFKRFFTRGFQYSSSSKSPDPADRNLSGTGSACDTDIGSPGNSTKSYSKRFFSKEWSWSRSKSRSASPAKNSSQSGMSYSRNLSATDESESSRIDSDRIPSSRHSQALKNWWSKRSSVTSPRSGMANSDQSSRVVLLEKVPASDDKDSEHLTVYVGERGGSLTKYVLEKHILQHHLFQVLLKCSQDELGTNHDYDSGLPIICDPALFLQVARVVGGDFSGQTTLCRG